MFTTFTWQRCRLEPLQESACQLCFHFRLFKIKPFIGLWHEHQRPDRDLWLIIHEDRAQRDERQNFIALNDIVVNTLGLPYDYTSIEQYDQLVCNHLGKSGFEGIKLVVWVSVYVCVRDMLEIRTQTLQGYTMKTGMSLKVKVMGQRSRLPSWRKKIFWTGISMTRSKSL